MSTLKVWLAERNMRQRRVAQSLGVSDQVVSRWCNRQSNIPGDYVMPLAKLLKLKPQDVLAVSAKIGKGKA
jgi:plasmid maintenance system antidote protein VapI